MQFNHYGGEAARLAADLVNAPDTGFTPEQLAPLLRDRGIADPTLTPDQTARLQRWRAQLAACFGDQPVDQRCARINALLAQVTTTPSIALHDGTPHLHYSSATADALAHLQAVVAAGLATVACSAGAHRLGRCARPGCEVVFVDTSRNGRRSYCTLRCANNEAVTRHRAAARR